MEFKTFSKENRSKFLEENKAFIFDKTKYFCNRDLQWSEDDELNIALIAFNRACESEKDIQGNFWGYANVLIHSALIQYCIKLENSPPLTFDLENKEYLNYFNSLTEFEIYFENKARAMEIALLSQELKKHSINFKKLIKLKLKDKNLKNDILNFVLKICKDEVLTENLLLNNSYDIKNLNSITNLDEKNIRTYKKYIIMLLLILSSDNYIYLKAYLNIRIGDSNA